MAWFSVLRTEYFAFTLNFGVDPFVPNLVEMNVRHSPGIVIVSVVSKQNTVTESI
jgi:hypothetical protein